MTTSESTVSAPMARVEPEPHPEADLIPHHGLHSPAPSLPFKAVSDCGRRRMQAKCDAGRYVGVGGELV